MSKLQILKIKSAGAMPIITPAKQHNLPFASSPLYASKQNASKIGQIQPRLLDIMPTKF